MNRHMANAGWGVLDYAAYPATMFVVAPFVLHQVGAAEYAMWTVTTAVISIGGVIASGFGDANIQRVARLRGEVHAAAAYDGMIRTVRSLLTIHLTLGVMLALIAWFSVPWIAHKLVHSDTVQASECIIALRIASVLILVRALETVAVSTQRAFEQFGSTVRISTSVRLLTLIAAAALALDHRHVVSMLTAAAVFMTLGTALQYRQLALLLGFSAVRPSLDRGSLRFLLRNGLFTWLQALGGILFGQLDRVVLAVTIGAAAAAPYLLCVQFAHPIAGLTGSALSFLLPHLSVRVAAAQRHELIQTLRRAFLWNLLFVAAGAGLLLAFGEAILRVWAGAAVAHAAAQLLPIVVLGSALMGLSVTATYALLALGNFRMLAFFSISVRASLLLIILLLARQHGAIALAWVRLAYGSLCMLLYLALRFRLKKHPWATAAQSSAPALLEVAPS